MHSRLQYPAGGFVPWHWILQSPRQEALAPLMRRPTRAARMGEIFIVVVVGTWFVGWSVGWDRSGLQKAYVRWIDIDR
jgi:hypothetical protein